MYCLQFKSTSKWRTVKVGIFLDPALSYEGGCGTRRPNSAKADCPLAGPNLGSRDDPDSWAPMVSHHFAGRKQKYATVELVTTHVRYGELLLVPVLEHLRLQLALIGCNQFQNTTPQIYSVDFDPKGNAL
jgi:hypothetical protein